MNQLCKALKPEHVILRLRAKDKAGAIRELADGLRGDARVRDWAGFLDAVMKREEGPSTSVGGGLAIPHARTDLVGDLCLAAGVSEEGIDFGPGEPVHFVVLAGVPFAMAADYLRILGCLARIFSDSKNAARVMDCEAPEDFVTLMERLSQRL